MANSCIIVSEQNALPTLVAHLIETVFRTDVLQPGFALIKFEEPVSSHELRKSMVKLKLLLSQQIPLRFLSMGRFDQQTTTKLHLDGAPEESFLILGYEPSHVRSRLFIGDYSRCAYDLGLTPRAFLDQYNPMFKSGAEIMSSYVVAIDCFDASTSQILIINNSSRTLDGKGFQGVMHQAIVDDPDPSKRRIVNSTMLEVSSAPEMITTEQQQYFISCESISESVRRN